MWRVNCSVYTRTIHFQKQILFMGNGWRLGRMWNEKEKLSANNYGVIVIVIWLSAIHNIGLSSLSRILPLAHSVIPKTVYFLLHFSQKGKAARLFDWFEFIFVSMRVRVCMLGRGGVEWVFACHFRLSRLKWTTNSREINMYRIDQITIIGWSHDPVLSPASSTLETAAVGGARANLGHWVLPRNIQAYCTGRELPCVLPFTYLL